MLNHHHLPLLDRLQARLQLLPQLLCVARSVKRVRFSLYIGCTLCTPNVILHHQMQRNLQPQGAPRAKQQKESYIKAHAAQRFVLNFLFEYLQQHGIFGSALAL